jgi:hypothetical protein
VKNGRKLRFPTVFQIGVDLDKRPADPMAFPCNVRRVLRTRVAKCLAALIIVVGIVPFAAPYATADVVELYGERVVPTTVPQTASAVQVMADFGLAAIAALLLMLQGGADRPAPGTALEERRPRVRVLRI